MCSVPCQVPSTGLFGPAVDACPETAAGGGGAGCAAALNPKIASAAATTTTAGNRLWTEFQLNDQCFFGISRPHLCIL
jgi:hypothetical protein